MSGQPPDPSGSIDYFAFGANMSASILQRRNVRPLAATSARLDGYALAFNLPGIPIYEPGFANIEPDEDAAVWGVLYRLSAADFRRLTVTEGDGEHYSSIEVVVAPGGDATQTATARCFRALRTDPTLKPSRRYLDHLLEGARSHGLPTMYVDSLAATPYVDPIFARSIMPRVLHLFDWMFAHGVAPNALINAAWKVRDKVRGWRTRG